MEFCARSDVGRVRTRNEDALEVRQTQAWALLADGMGGYRGGDVASRIAVAAALQRLEYEVSAGRAEGPDALAGVLSRAVCVANDEIRREAMKTPELSGMGSTLVVATFLADCVVSVHVGDSRLYRLSEGGLQQLTRDHTMLQELVDGGIMSAEESARSQFRGLLTRGLGVSATVVPEVGTHAARAGDIFLLCSDGLTDMLADDEIADVLASIITGDGLLAPAADRLVELANCRGGRDNISVILARMAV
ncbi:PP2C family protein-serine/threonine phosphatase [Aromatoleum diolicum]|nr:PP2C family serine/threonine-protein phosphatase [Aromatoleum diolicum]